MLQEQDILVTNKARGIVRGELGSKNRDLSYLKPESMVLLADGIDNLLSYIASDLPTPKEAGSSAHTGWGGFNAFNNYDEAMDTFRNRPQDVVKFDPSELRISDDNESGNRVDYDVVGDYIDMGRYMEGVPESWGHMLDGNARNRRANIIVDIAQASYMKDQEINHRGERILRLIDALEAGGVRTQLTAIESTECGHIEIVLKRHEEPLTISDLAVVIHSEFLRRICFRISEYSKTWEGGYGSSIRFSNAISRKPGMLHSNNNDEVNIYMAGNMNMYEIDRDFDKLERLLQWELSKPAPEVDAIKLDNGIYFNPNGYRAEAEIKREGQEVINAE